MTSLAGSVVHLLEVPPAVGVGTAAKGACNGRLGTLGGGFG